MAIAFSENGVNNVKLYINIVNPCSTGVQVNISAPRLPSFPMRQEYVGPKEIIVIDIDTAKFEVEGTGKSGQGILLHSNDTELIITGLSTAYNSADMYFTRNATQLGTEYVIITYCYSDGLCQFVIVAMEDNTAIEILFPQYFASSIVFDGNSYSACDVMILTLQESQTFQLQSTSDLSGVKIISPNRKRFTVISSSPLTAVQNGGGGRDQVADIVPPLTAWGNEYIIVRRNSQDYLHDDIKFVAAAGGANISIFGCGPVINHFVVPHQIYLYQMTCERVHIISDEPVLVAHFPVGFGNGDPAMLFPTPVSHYVRQYTVYIPSGFDFCAIALVMNSLEVSTFNYSDTFIPWIRIGQSMFSTAWLENLNSGVVYIEHTSPFGGHVICEKAWSMSALTIGIGNFTSHEAQDHSKTSDSSESSTMPIVHGNYSSSLNQMMRP
ncbi:uncharacterized protein LOC132555081 [Ylistrum balloti]|uniref:uncharacterized protein LOC132555081 n=1 Tax=Ylistrum balloti TaxID=509963 RepID=UPI002905B1EA|nr:uncharacterized protein LOC132555081 [Ylistrum balloti]